MLKVVVVEDQEVYSQHIIELIKKWAKERECDLPNIALSRSGDKLVKLVQNGNKYDIMFIDIELKDSKNGVDLAHLLRKSGYKNLIVFTTNHEEFWPEGFSVEAYRYFTKPIKYENVKVVMDKAMENYHGSFYQYTFRDVYHNIPYKDILYISSWGHVITIHTKTTTHQNKISLKKLQEELPNNFVRCQRSYIVNVNYVDRLVKNRIYLTDDTMIDVGAGHLELVRNVISEKINA